VAISVPGAFAGVVIEKLGGRGGVLLRHEVDGNGVASLELEIPTRGLIGYRSEFLTDTRGEGLLYHAFARYGAAAGNIRRRANGAIIVQETCTAVTYALHTLQDRGRLFVSPGERVYAGQVMGLHSRGNDLIVNPGRAKQLTNFRNTGHEEALRLTPATRPGLEDAIELIVEDELVEVTPAAVRIRKRLLDHNARKRELSAARLAAGE
jgi:GTP-binding protein